MTKKDYNNNSDNAIKGFLGGWSEFVKGLHLGKPIMELTRVEKFWIFFNKLLIVFFASALTTLSLYVFINPNGIYNSGLNGLLQIFTKILIGTNINNPGKISWKYYYVIYYFLNFTINFFIFLFFNLFFETEFEIIGTSFFYIFFQIIWTFIFDFFNISEIFTKFNPETWDIYLSKNFYFTFPYYVLVSVIASLINSYGNSLIFKAKSTTGGFDIIYTHISSKQKKKDNKKSFFISSRILSFFVVFVITFSNFFLANDKKFILSELSRDFSKLIDSYDDYNIPSDFLLSLKKNNSKIILSDFEKLIEEWKEAIKKSNYLSLDDSDNIESYEIKKKWEKVTNFFTSKFKDHRLEEYPDSFDYYLYGINEITINKINDEIKKTKKEIVKSKEDNKKIIFFNNRINFLEEKADKINFELKKNIFQRYLTYISNDEKFWGTVVFIFSSSMIMSNIFPRDKNVFLQIYSYNEEVLNSILKILEREKIFPFYSDFNDKIFEKKVFFIWCFLDKWKYQLLSYDIDYLLSTDYNHNILELGSKKYIINLD